MISGHATIETAIEATKLGAKDFIEKPVSIEKLLASAEEALSQNIIGEDIFSHLIQNTPAFIKTLDEARPHVKENNIFVLRAEEGLEKTAWARALYLNQYSDRDDFQKIEFSRKESAENKESDALYKALENGNNLAIYIENMHKLSEDEKSSIRQRLMISAKKNTAKIFIGVSEKEESFFMSEGSFTEVYIPPLRASLKEIPHMLDETVKFFVERDGHGYRRFSLAAQNRLSKYQWPGNLRQLADLVQALLTRRDKEIVNVDEIQEIIT